MAVAIIGPKFYAWDDDTGAPLAFGKVYTYETGTSTPKATFQTEAGTTPNANPVILNGAGYADIYLDGTYKIVLKDADDVEVWSSDPVSDSTVQLFSELASEVAGEGASLVSMEDGPTVEVAVKNRVIRVSSRTEMKAYDVPAGYQFSLDEGGRSGDFVFRSGDQSANVSADSLEGIWVAPDSDPTGGSGAFMRRYDGITSDGGINVQWYGATGDGTTNDHPAIQAAVDYKKFGKLIYIPEGDYKIESTVLVDTSGDGTVSTPRIFGDGFSYTRIDNQAGAAAFKVDSGTGVEFAYGFGLSDMEIFSTGTNAGTIGVEINGARFASLKDLRIDGMASHGIYGIATIGDLTDSAQIKFEQVEVLNCGGYGAYAEGFDGAIQYNWNFDQCRFGRNTLGGVLLESMVNCELTNCGFFYNTGFGLRVSRGGGSSVAPKQIRIQSCEFDTNDGTQIDLVDGINISIVDPYLIGNVVTGATFAKGINVGSATTGVYIEGSSPRFNGSLTGLTVHEFEAGCTDAVVRDTQYSGYSISNGDMYVINEPTVVVDDVQNRNFYETDTYTAELKNSTGTVTSPTTVTAYYSRNGNVVTVAFRDLNNVDVSGFSAGDFIAVTLPYSCITGSTSSYIGNCIITSDAGSGTPFPVVENGGSQALFVRAGTGAFVTAGNLTSGTSDIANFTLTYLAEDK